jgi:hypothetical protein
MHLHLGTQRHLLARIGSGVDFLETPGNVGNLGVRLRAPDAGFEPCFDGEVPPVAPDERIPVLIRKEAGSHHHRNEHRRPDELVHAREGFRRHTDHGEIESVEPD